MSTLATVIEVDALWQTIWTAAVAGIAVSIVFSVGVLGAARSQDMRRDGRGVAAAAYGLLGLAGGAATLGAIVYGLLLITNK